MNDEDIIIDMVDDGNKPIVMSNKANHLNPIIAAGMDRVMTATSWNLPRMIEYLDAMLDKLQEDDTVITLGGLTEGLDITINQLRIALDRWRGDPAVQHRTAKIHDILHNRVISQGARAKINPVFAIFMLKNLYNWEDRRQIERTDLNDRIPEGKARQIFAAFEKSLDITPHRPDKIGDYVKREED